MEPGIERSMRLDEAPFRRLYESLRSSLPWDPSDRRGALNYIGPAQVLAATKELAPGDHVTTEELRAAEKEQGVRLGQGDIAFVHVGHRRRRRERGPWDASHARAGLHPDTAALLAERRVSVLGSDGNNDTAPSITAGVDFPAHVLVVNALGVHLLDYRHFDEVIAHCKRAGRWSFLCVIGPLGLADATGSLVNPIAIL